MAIWPWRRAEPQNTVQHSDLYGGDLGAVDSGHTPVRSPGQAMTVNAAYRAVSFKVRQYSALPWLAYDLDPLTGERIRRRRGDWLHRLLAIRPNAFQTPFEFWAAMGYQLELTGAAFAAITRNAARTEVLSLMPLTTSSVTVEIVDDQTIVYTVRDSEGKDNVFTNTRDRSQILHVRGIHSDILHPVSPIAAMRLGLETSLALQTHRHSTFSKRGISSPMRLRQTGTVNLEDKNTQRYLKVLKRQQEGPKESGAMMVIPKGFEVDTDAISLRDLQYIESEQLSQHEVMGIWGVWPSLLGEEDQAKYATAQAAAQAFEKFTLRPVIEQIEQAVKRDVLGPKMNIATDVEMSTDELLRGDQATRAAVWSGLVRDGIATTNEARVKLGMMASDQEGADVLTKQAQNIPLAPDEPAADDDDNDNEAEADVMAAAMVSRLARDGFDA